MVKIVRDRNGRITYKYIAKYTKRRKNKQKINKQKIISFKPIKCNCGFERQYNCIRCPVCGKVNEVV